MITLLGSLLGFGSSMLPKVFEIFTDRSDKSHELKVLEMQMKAQSQGHGERLEEINAEADIKEIQSLHQHDKLTGVGFIDGLRGSVRPVVTYVFLALFVTVEIVALFSLINAGTNAGDALQIIWSQDINSLWAAILSFWFGSRAIRNK
tara:strand:+ start:1476 stop:1919 length:444 start_codon:yes stop_codon:yes gene_type:complete